MGQILHGSARTTAAVRRAIQHSQESLRALAQRYDINPKTVAKWRKRTTVHDAPMGPQPEVSESLCLGSVGLLFFPQLAEEKNRVPNWMANWPAAAFQLIGGLFHFLVTLRKAR